MATPMIPSLSDIFARCGRTINPLLENTRSAGEELAGTARIQAFSSLKSQAQGQGLRSEGLGQGLEVSRPRLRTWTLALMTKTKAK